jgi:hypothetical protein
MAVAPQGAEGTFAGIANAVTFLAEVPAGLLGGWLLERHCASAEACDGASMFAELAAVALISPVCLWMCPTIFREPHLDGGTTAGGAQGPFPPRVSLPSDVVNQKEVEMEALL